MLVTLKIKDFAIISHLEINFEPGFNIISGETGAGKSILVGAVNLLLGGRASQELIRSGAREARVEALFDLSTTPSTRKNLSEYGHNPSDELVVTRNISQSGKNRVLINGHLATVSMLQKVTSGLVSISGQHEHQKLLDPETHIEILDSFGNINTELHEYRDVYARYLQLQNELVDLQKQAKNRQNKMEFVQFQINEIENAHLKPDEEKNLREEINLLRHAEQLFSAATESYNLLYGERGAVMEKLSAIQNQLQELVEIDTRRKDLLANIDQSLIQLTDVAYSLRDYKNSIQFNPDHLAMVESRFAQIQRLTKKYGGSIKETLYYLDELKNEMHLLDKSEILIDETQKKLEKILKRISVLADNISMKRKTIASQLRKAVEKNLYLLGMQDSKFDVVLTQLDNGNYNVNGKDVVEFFFSANPGEPAKQLVKIASGGELSRIMLALKVLLTDSANREVLIFDEVDAGIGGKTAALVGKMLHGIARNHQVICITHLPQIASFGGCHFSVRKELVQGRTKTSVCKLREKEREKELARMLGGMKISDKTLAHAREMLNTNNQKVGK